MTTAVEFITISALWGGSFLFMRMAGPQFGVIPLIGMRVAIAGLFLLPICLIQGKAGEIRLNWKKIAILGLTSAAAPFTLLAYTTVKTNASFGSILNSTAPFFTALIAWLWLKDKMSLSRVAGLVIGFGGVVLLVRGKVSFDSAAKVPAVAAALAATFLYGFTTNYTKRYLQDVSPLVISTVSQLCGAILLAPFTFWLWPSVSPTPSAWLSIVLLGVFCTSLAFVLFYRLVVKIGASKAIVVTFLIPVFGMLWGALILHEKLTLSMLAATAVILIGTSLSTGLFKLKRISPPSSA